MENNIEESHYCASIKPGIKSLAHSTSYPPRSKDSSSACKYTLSRKDSSLYSSCCTRSGRRRSVLHTAWEQVSPSSPHYHSADVSTAWTFFLCSRVICSHCSAGNSHPHKNSIQQLTACYSTVSAHLLHPAQKPSAYPPCHLFRHSALDT